MEPINRKMHLAVEDPKVLQMRYVAGELKGLREIISYLWDGNQEAFSALLFIKSNYKEWPAMIMWLKKNNLRGDKLSQLFKNESPDGGGYHMGATYILSRLKGMKYGTESINASELL